MKQASEKHLLKARQNVMKQWHQKPEPAETHEPEPWARLSETPIWSWLEGVYQQGGRELWENVPFHITSNPFIAEHYAELILSFLLDCQEHLDKNDPVYILELGAGSGCFSFHLLNELERRQPFFPNLQDISIRYLVTDFSLSEPGLWRDNPEFIRYQKEGKLDFAVFKPEAQHDFSTLTGWKIAPGTVKNPVIAIANYLFDSLRQDAFRTSQHQLQEVLHRFFAQKAFPAQPGEIFNQLQKEEKHLEVTMPYYDEPIKDKILEDYARDLENATFLMPIGALNCIKNLRLLSNGRLALISTDKGYGHSRHFLGHAEHPFCAHHGIFSYCVNFDAIARCFAHHGGKSFTTDVPASSVETQMAVLMEGLSDISLTHTRYHFEERVARKNPINGIKYCANLIADKGECEAQEGINAYLALIRLSNCDQATFIRCADELFALLPERNAYLEEELVLLLDELEKKFYFLSKRHDSLYHIGAIRYMLNRYDDALRVLSRSAQLFGPTSHSLYYMAACYEVTNQAEAALEHYRRSLALDPVCKTTKAAIVRVQKKLPSS